jgi:tRNA1Val (adenine37-N6)-methyltransferase
MSNPYFQFKQFTVWHDQCAMKVGTDSVLLGAWTDTEEASSILDIGTGTGIIALMLAQRSHAHIDALDIDSIACQQASDNIRKSPWPDKIRVINKSFENYYRNSTDKYDLLVSNPPFFKNSLKPEDNKRSMARHADSLPYQELLAGVAQLITDNGRFCIVLPYTEAQLFIVDAALHYLYCNLKLNVKPCTSDKVNRVLMQFSKKRTILSEENISILDDKRKYTLDYKKLTKEYYLNF